MSENSDNEWETANSTAVANVATSVASSTAINDMDLARAGTELQSMVISIFVPVKLREQVKEDGLAEIKASVKRYEDQANKYDVPNTYIFQLKQDLDNCLKGAKSIGERAFCYASYIGGLGKAVNDTVRGII